MLYRITIDLAVQAEHELTPIKALITSLWPKVIPINPGQPHEEPAFMLIQRCYHDEPPPRECETIYYLRKPPLPT